MNHYIIQSLDSYMLSNNFINKFEAYRIQQPEKKNDSNHEKNKKDLVMKRKEVFDDSLFYTFIIMLYGNDGFELFQMKENITERQLKLKIADNLNTRKNEIKSYNVASLLHMEEDLMHNRRIDTQTFFTLCCLEHFNVILISRRIGYILNSNEGEPFFLVNKNKQDNYILESELVNDIQLYNNDVNVHWLENIKKPLKAISNYKISELRDLYSTVFQSGCDKKTKKDLYEELAQVVKL